MDDVHTPSLTRRILIVDDDEDVQAAMITLLEAKGFAAEAVGNGRLALERLRAMPDAPALIILDLAMPEMDGSEFRAEQSRSPRFRSVPVVLVTGAPDGEDRAAAMGVAYLRKPVGAAAILHLVSRYCAAIGS